MEEFITAADGVDPSQGEHSHEPAIARTATFVFPAEDSEADVLEFAPHLGGSEAVRVGLPQYLGRRSAVVISASGARVDLAPFTSPGHIDLIGLSPRPLVSEVGPGSALVILGLLRGSQGEPALLAWGRSGAAALYVLCVEATHR